MKALSYELLGCGLHGHYLVGTDAADIRDQDGLVARVGTPVEVGGSRTPVRWHRCLRCDAWVPVPQPASPGRRHPPGRGEIALPLRGRALRDRYVLRLIALDRAFHVLVLAALAGAIFAFLGDRSALRQDFYRILADFQGGFGGPVSKVHHGILGELDKLFTLDPSRLRLTAVLVLAYAALEAVEMVGLWMTKRWAEYLTFLATIVLLPFTVYELTIRVSYLKVAALVLDLAIAAYLVWAKRLFGIRGGARAEAERRRADSGWDALERGTPPNLPSA